MCYMCGWVGAVEICLTKLLHIFALTIQHEQKRKEKKKNKKGKENSINQCNGNLLFISTQSDEKLETNAFHPHATQINLISSMSIIFLPNYCCRLSDCRIVAFRGKNYFHHHHR